MSDATTVPMGKINVAGRDEAGRVVQRQVQLETRVSATGEPVQVQVEDGRTIEVSAKLADLYPERFTRAKATKSTAKDA